MPELDQTGIDWLIDEIDNFVEQVEHITPSEFNEKTRYLPESVTSIPGYIRYAVNPFMREIVDCFDINSPVREVNLKKGVQITYSTVLESGALYFMAHVKTIPIMYMTADKELAKARIENNFLPMLAHSDLSHIIRSSDEGNIRKTGKALSVDTIIPTPKGYRRIGDLSVGDKVFSLDGTSTKIITESPIHKRYCYEVVFANGEKIIASDDHRWVVCRSGDSKDRTLTTKKLFDAGVKMNKGYRYRVRIPAPIMLSDKVLKIEPYTLGVWLGDGDSNGAKLTAGDDASQIVKEIEKDGYFTKKNKNRNRCDTYSIRVHNDFRYMIGYGFKVRLDSYKLVKNKHIPEVYFKSSIDQRMRLLQGLMDTDGCVSKKGECEITQKNKTLAHDIWKLVNSLGVKATIKHRIAKSQNGTKSDVYRVKFYATKNEKPFTLDRKLSRLKNNLQSRSKKNTIKEIKPIGKRVVKCIGVDHPSKLFLCGESCIPTHNTANHLQWEGGGYMVPFGAKNADKMRAYSIAVMLKDEIDAWPEVVGKDGDPDKLSDGRLKGYWERRKIFRGSTPTILSVSKIQKQYLRGDQRQYNVLCKSCSFPQVLRWEAINKETGIIGGFMWDTEQDVLQVDSVRYCCQNCGFEHYEYDKEWLFSEDHGAKWIPTAKPVEPNIRSYHLPAMYSPIGMAPWYSLVSDWIECWDVKERKVKDVGKFQVFKNNVLAEPFEILGSKISRRAVSLHRRMGYRLGEIPNNYAVKYSGSHVLFLMCQVDVHKSNLAVSVLGFTRDMRCYLIDYWRFEVNKKNDDCSEISNPVWGRLRDLIEEKEYVADDGKKYRIIMTLIDAGWSNETIVTFCSDYGAGVYPILGRDRPSKNQTIKEFAQFKTQSGVVGYRIIVDHYKDRMAPVLRREWYEESGMQKPYHFNAPVDITEKQLDELTKETKRDKVDPTTGVKTYYWYRPGNAPNELWDLINYGYAGVEILAWSVCVDHFELETIDWPKFWDYIEENKLYYTE